MKDDISERDDFKQFRRLALKVHRLFLEDFIARGAAPEAEVIKTARITTYRLLFFLAAGCRGLMGIPDFRKSPRPFMQNIHKWVRDNPPHSRRHFSYSDLFEPARQPFLWRLHPSDDVLKEAISIMVETDPSTWPVIWPGSVYPYLLEPGERREAGSFYTPDHVVNYIVAQALSPMCYRIPEKQRGIRDPDEILSARVLDPAMGDGRFLIKAVDYLAKALAATRGEELSPHHRIEVARRCIYGVDRDPMVVDIARIALWLHLGGLETETYFLRQRIQTGDALMGAMVEDIEKSLTDIEEERSQLGLFKPESIQAAAVPLRKVAESGRIIERIKSLAHLWTSVYMDNEGALELFGPARISLARASDEKWAEFDAHPAMQRALRMAQQYGFIHWELRFPEVFFPKENRPAGFNAIIGNPPYHKERDYSEGMEWRLSPISRKWGESKMDLISLFIHRGLDLLAPGGRLSFITSSYWLQAEGARRLRRRLVENENILSFLDLGQTPVFPGLTGRHCVLTVSNEIKHPNPTVIMTVKSKWEGSPDVLDHLGEDLRDYFDVVEVRDQAHLLDDDGSFHLGDRDVEALCRKMENGTVPLGELVKSSQGIIDNPPELNEKIIARFGETNPELLKEMNYRAGEPVFTIPPGHPLLEKLSEAERVLLRPFYKPSSIRPFALSSKPDAYLLYLTPETCPDINAFPNLKQHLERYSPIMELRREVKEGRIRWWHLHWSREAEIFESEHLLVPQMVDVSTAALTNEPAYVGMSVHVIAAPRNARPTARFIEALLNSRAVRFWLDHGRRAKRRGLRLDVTLATLRKIPVPIIKPEADESASARVKELMKMYREVVKDDRKD